MVSRWFCATGVASESHSEGKAILASANSSVPTPGTLYLTPYSMKPTLASSGPWPQARTFSPALTDVPTGTGRWTKQVTFFDSTSQPSETNFQ